MGQANFFGLLGQYLVQAAYSGVQPDGNFRFGPPEPGEDGKRHMVVPDAAKDDAKHFLYLFPLFDRFDRALALFQDEYSRRLLLLLVAHRILGPERVQLNISRKEYQDTMDQLAPLMVRAETYRVPAINMTLDQYDLHSADIPLRVHTTRSSALAHFFLRQYECNRDGVSIMVEPGDTVVEGGMGFGDTALLFSHMAGPEGRIIAFEFETSNLVIIRDNFAANPDAAARIDIQQYALSNQSGQTMEFAMAGPATQPVRPGMHYATPIIKVETMTIDDMVTSRNLPRVDFIKLDVEGCEMATLYGATETLARFRPKLALSAYHKVDDIPQILTFLHDLNLGYAYWLDHFRYYNQETIIFAKATS